VEGHGLVYNIGRRVQGFTSAINVMAPAFFYAITGRSEWAALQLYRLICLAAFVAGGWIFLRLILKDRPADRWTPGLFILLYVLDAKTVAFTMNGQESAFMVLFLAIGFASACHGFERTWRWLAVSFTGLLYTRPDAPMYIAALAFAGLVFRPAELRPASRGVVRAAAVAGVLFLPWFLWAWSYYGNPFPNTMSAKSRFDAAQWLDPAGTIINVLGMYPMVSTWVFQPIYAVFGGWPSWLIHPYALLCTVVCTAYWMIPSSDRLGRMASLLFCLTALYMSLVNYGAFACPWYLPAVTVFGTFVLARAIHPIIQRMIPLSRASLGLSRVVQVYLVVCAVALLSLQTWQMRIQQREIEDNLRRPLGLYLQRVAKPDQRIFLEPIGYIGYYSDRLIWDWPGLVCPEIVRMRKQLDVDRIEILPHLMPEWLVLRRQELELASQLRFPNETYEIVREFDARPVLDAYGYIPGRGYIAGDVTYYVLKRQSVIPATNPVTTGP
jgi:hypothetical protein